MLACDHKLQIKHTQHVRLMHVGTATMNCQGEHNLRTCMCSSMAGTEAQSPTAKACSAAEQNIILLMLTCLCLYINSLA